MNSEWYMQNTYRAVHIPWLRAAYVNAAKLIFDIKWSWLGAESAYFMTEFLTPLPPTCNKYTLNMHSFVVRIKSNTTGFF